MDWVAYQDIATALKKDALPVNNSYDSDYSTPDVYGRAIQQYISLWDALRGSDFEKDSVKTWRGFLTLLALRGHLSLPLYWTRVDLTEEMRFGNLFYLALKHPVENRERLLFPDNHAWRWNGRVFYALQWAPKGENPEDLLLYSPFTLIYPVADWRKKLKKIADRAGEASRSLSRFFDVSPAHGGEPCFRSVTARTDGGNVLNPGESDAVYYYLSKLRGELSGANDTVKTIGGHIRQFQDDLVNNLSVIHQTPDLCQLCLFPPAPEDAVQRGWIPDVLQSYVQIGEGRYFAEQVCYFKVKPNNSYPFADKDYFERNYKIENAPNGEQWYAFLPIHPDHRKDCVSSGLAGSVSMRYEGDNPDNERIAVSMTVNGRPLTRYYAVSHSPTMEGNKAVCLNASEEPLTIETWPSLAVWPNRIGRDWQEYYVMLDQADVSETPAILEIANVRNLIRPSPYESDISDIAESSMQKSSEYVVKTSYVPDAIPLVKTNRPRERPVTVGMILPRTAPAYAGLGVVRAEVAVDFGTSSSRIFAKIDGKAAVELDITGNEPKEVIRYKGAEGKTAAVAKNLVKPLPLPNADNQGTSEVDSPRRFEKTKQKLAEERKKAGERADRTLFSFFRKSLPSLEFEEVVPVLDGNIYQPTTKETIADNNRLETNLKWNLYQKGKYYIAFMKQLLLQITVNLNAQGVRQIDWKYSLPHSMDERDKREMRRIWTEQMQEYLSQISGKSITHTIEPKEVTESVAASRYFIEAYPKMVSQGKGFLVVDIGGGSTDAALWQTQNGRLSMVWQDSVKIAGQRLCTQWMEEYLNDFQNSMKLVSKDSINEFSTLVGAIPTEKPEIKDALVDRLLTFYSVDMMSGFESNCKEAKGVGGWGLRLYKQLAQGISLMMYTLGCQTGLLYANGQFQITKRDGFFTIAFGGRGSAILDWLENVDWLPYSNNVNSADKVAESGKTKEENTISRLFYRGMLCGESLLRDSAAGTAGRAEPLREVMSEDIIRVIRNRDDPKCEVARGLLEPPSNGETDAYHAVSHTGRTEGLSGEYYKTAVDEFPKAFQDVFSAHDGIQLPEFEKHSLATLVEREMPAYGANLNDAFRLLMSAMYRYLETKTDAAK